MLTSTFKNKDSLRTIEAQIVQKLKNNEARPKFTSSYKKKKKRRVSFLCNVIISVSGPGGGGGGGLQKPPPPPLHKFEGIDAIVMRLGRTLLPN